MRFGQTTVEFHYLKIKPLIIAEEYLQEDNDSISSSLVDYKVWCFNGKAFCICTYFNRTALSVGSNVYDKEWNKWEKVQSNNGHIKVSNIIITKPEKLDLLIEYAERISSGHPQMRVDFYIVKGKIYFGEITMTSLGGYMNYFTYDFLLKMGKEARKGLKRMF